MTRPLISAIAVGSLLLSVGCGGVEVDAEGNAVAEEVPAAELATTTQAIRTQAVICAGGYAPVRYWNPSTCGGTVHDYYPQGWHGWYETVASCTSGTDVYFHPNNGAHGGWIESWRICRT